MTRPVLFSDIDGTLCFHHDANGVNVLGPRSEGLTKVEDSVEGGAWACYDVSTSSYSVYMAEKTRALLFELKELADIVLITGGRPSTCEKRLHLLDFAHSIIAENGGVIFDHQMHRDEEWWGKFEKERRMLAEVEAYIKSYDWILDNKGRSTMLRVRLKDNPHKNEEKFKRLCEVVRLPPELKSTINLGNLDIIPTHSGKGNVVKYMKKKMAIPDGFSYGVGDDINDAPFLRVCDHPYVLKSAYPKVIEEAKASGWTISNSRTFNGIHEILQQMIAEAQQKSS